ncbi:MAG: hypothetical protein ACKVON_09515 [Beijerinckiaceae bacterium]
MTDTSQNLTGVWHGLYSYEAFREPVYFVATLIDGGSFINGSTHESEVGEAGAPLTLFAMIDGSRQATEVSFTKAYDGSGGWDHIVLYEGSLNGDATEIEGRWHIGGKASGKFLMIRNRGVSESIVRQVFEKV